MEFTDDEVEVIKTCINFTLGNYDRKVVSSCEDAKKTINKVWMLDEKIFDYQWEKENKFGINSKGRP